MKHFYSDLIAAVLLAFSACSPIVDPPPPTTLNVIKTGGIMNKTAAKTDTNSYDFALSCTCPFSFKVENFDTVSIQYDTTGISQSLSSHVIKAYGKKGLAPGKYTGSLAVLAYPTQENFRDTLRDTVIVK